MLEELNDQLFRAKASLRSKRKLEAMLQHAKQSIDRDEAMCEVYRKTLKTEQLDVEQLEGLTLTALLSKLFGTRDEKLRKERQEFAEAKLKLEQAEISLKAAMEKLNSLRQGLAPLANADADYHRLIEEKEKLLSSNSSSRYGELLGITEQLAEHVADRKELLEAIQAGESAVRSLQDVKAELESAAGWGTWDMLGGGMIATIAKHSRIDTAKQKGQFAQLQLERFQDELADAGVRLNLALKIDGFSKFADFFFDGFVSDWIVQSKIQNASSVCSTTMSSVQLAVHQCERRLNEINEAIEDLDSRRLEFIEKC